MGRCTRHCSPGQLHWKQDNWPEKYFHDIFMIILFFTIVKYAQGKAVRKEIAQIKTMTLIAIFLESCFVSSFGWQIARYLNSSIIRIIIIRTIIRILPFYGERDDCEDGGIGDGLGYNNSCVTSIVSKRPRVLIPTLIEFDRKSWSEIVFF